MDLCQKKASFNYGRLKVGIHINHEGNTKPPSVIIIYHSRSKKKSLSSKMSIFRDHIDISWDPSLSEVDDEAFSRFAKK